MLIGAVDLAASMWAMCFGDGAKSQGGGNLFVQFSAAEHPSESEAVSIITAAFSVSSIEVNGRVPDVLVIEDQPHAVRWDTTAKNVARMQGRIAHQMDLYGYVDRILFVQPNVWQSALGANRKTSQETTAIALALGYTPPDLITKYASRFTSLKGKERQQVRNRLKKLETDYVDAFLIYAWSVQHHLKYGTFDNIKGAQRYVR